MEEERRKVYVEVDVTHKTDGTARPRKIKFEDGEVYEIDRVVKLLENVADEKRKRECDEVAEDAAPRHIHIALIFLLQDAEFRHNNIHHKFFHQQPI